jgi:hypothetical protein
MERKDPEVLGLAAAADLDALAALEARRGASARGVRTWQREDPPNGRGGELACYPSSPSRRAMMTFMISLVPA